MDQMFLNMNDASRLTGFSKSTLYKLTARRMIEFYRPLGKKIFFSREQLETMMKQNLKKTGAVLGEQAAELLKLKHCKDD